MVSPCSLCHEWVGTNIFVSSSLPKEEDKGPKEHTLQRARSFVELASGLEVTLL